MRNPGETKISHLDNDARLLSWDFGHEEVVGLDISMDPTASVESCETIRRLGEYSSNALPGKMLIDELPERAVLTKLKDNVGGVGLQSVIQNGDNVGMVPMVQKDTGLAGEPYQGVALRAVKQLHRHDALTHGVVCTMDDPKASGSDPLKKLVALCHGEASAPHTHAAPFGT